MGSFTWLAYTYMTLSQDVVTFWAEVTPQGVIDLYNFLVVGPAHIIFLRSHHAWVSDRFVKRHESRACSGSGP